jgi:hypothetical protein
MGTWGAGIFQNDLAAERIDTWLGWPAGHIADDSTWPQASAATLSRLEGARAPA